MLCFVCFAIAWNWEGISWKHLRQHYDDLYRYTAQSKYLSMRACVASGRVENRRFMPHFKALLLDPGAVPGPLTLDLCSTRPELLTNQELSLLRPLLS